MRSPSSSSSSLWLLLSSSALFAEMDGGGGSTSTTTSTTASGIVNPSSLLYAEHEKLLVSRGEFEAGLVSSQTIPLAANVVKGSGGGGGFGGGKGGGGGRGGGGGGSKKSLLKAQAQSHAQVLRDQGVVRIDNVLSPPLADSLRALLYEKREASERLLVAAGGGGGAPPLLSKTQTPLFADVLLTHNRRDMTLPIGPEWAAEALQAIVLESPVGATVGTILGEDAILREWSCLMSDPGSQRQVMHPDTPWQEEPVLYTCFVALQDITDDMGPTTWLPGTHTQAMHERFQDESIYSGSTMSPKDELLSTQPSVLGTLPKGACAIFDSRLLHCGGANQSPKNLSRALMYCSFQNPKITQVGNPGSIRSHLIGKWTLKSLTQELELFRKGKPNQLLVPGEEDEDEDEDRAVE